MDMIFDPADVNMALRTADRRLLYRAAAIDKQNPDEWVLLDELHRPSDPRSIPW